MYITLSISLTETRLKWFKTHNTNIFKRTVTKEPFVYLETEIYIVCSHKCIKHALLSLIDFRNRLESR